VDFPDWSAVFTYLTDKVISVPGRKGKLVLVLDELQWLAAGQGRLTSLIKYYWDNHWKQRRVLLILCGSLASYMIERVIRSSALYGRISLELLVKGLQPRDAARLFGERRSKEEVLRYLLVMGTVPRYLELVNTHRSFTYNMNRLFFSPQAIMKDEIERIFYSQFREKTTYRAIVDLLQSGLWSMDEVARRIGMASGGGIKRYLRIMEQSEIISSYVPFNKQANSRLKCYSLADEYLRFHFKYLEPNRAIIDESQSASLFELLTAESFQTWLGFAFERFCIKHSHYLARRMGFGDRVLRAAPYYGKGDKAFQIDLLYQRADKIVVICEIKFYSKRVSTTVIPEIKRKTGLFKPPAGHSIETALISLYGPDQALRDAQFFDYYLTLEEILGA
jgi:hypothetical protein